MATEVGRGRICLASFNSTTPKTPLLYEKISRISLTQEFVWRRSIARPRKPPAIRKDHRDIFHISRVIADFVPNFVAMATGVGRSRIYLATFNSPSPKTACYAQRSPGYLLYKSSYSRFYTKFRCRGNGGWSQ